VQDSATVSVLVYFHGAPAAGARIVVSFQFSGNTAECSATTDAGGHAQCSVVVPPQPIRSTIDVLVQAVTETGDAGSTSTSFVIE
jgi:hypothetical protein